MQSKIKQLRTQKGLTMRALADTVGTSQQQIDRLEKGKRRLTIEWLEKLSTALECSITDLLPTQKHHSDGSSTAKARVIGTTHANCNIEPFSDTEKYTLLFGRPQHIKNPRLFAILVSETNQYGVPAGSELIFTELTDTSTASLTEGKLVVCESSNPEGHKIHTLERFPVKDKNKRVRAHIVKTILNED